jgi:hypothetical protein
MAFTIEDLISSRPYVFHTSSWRNFKAITRSNLLRSSYDLLWRTEHEYLLDSRRISSVIVRLNGDEVEIRDHRPLRPGSIQFEAVCDVSENGNRDGTFLVESLGR